MSNEIYGICKICGCKDDDPCWEPNHGCCWWVDDTHTLCSHCSEEDIVQSDYVVHCIVTDENQRHEH